MLTLVNTLDGRVKCWWVFRPLRQSVTFIVAVFGKSSCRDEEDVGVDQGDGLNGSEHDPVLEEKLVRRSTSEHKAAPLPSGEQ
jgi:hypothetical protein